MLRQLVVVLLLFCSAVVWAIPRVEDYVIIGGGTAGLVLANRLSSNRNVTVTVLEAGDPSQSSVGGQIFAMPSIRPTKDGSLEFGKSLTIYDVPLLWVAAAYSGIPGYNWPIPGVNVAKILGGCSAHNAMLFIRGIRQDFEKWNIEGWSWPEMLTYYKKLERNVGNFSRMNDAYHGFSGPMTVSSPSNIDPEANLFLESCKAAGHPENFDFNGETREGCGYFQHNIKNGIRDSSANAYLAPVQIRTNLRLVLNAEVTRILFNGTRAYAVEYILFNQRRYIRVSKDVILTAGALNTPKILQLSGIGDGRHLRTLGIPLMSHRPGVGRNLQTHKLVPLHYLTPSQSFPNIYGQGFATIAYATNGTGYFATPGVFASSFLKTRSDLAVPDVNVFHLPGDPLNYFPNQKVTTFAVGNCNPSSRNSYVQLTSRDPLQSPFVHLDIVDDSDIKTLARGIKELRKIVSTPPLASYLGSEINPGRSVATDDQIAAWVRSQTFHHDHWSGTAKMGPETDITSVVDNRLRVHGVTGLRVCDASVMPSLPHGFAHATVLAIAEKAADLIREDHQLTSIAK